MIMSINDELEIIYDNVNIDEFDYSMRMFKLMIIMLK